MSSTIETTYWRTRNYVGTIVGGSMNGVLDPIHMFIPGSATTMASETRPSTSYYLVNRPNQDATDSSTNTTVDI